MPPAGSPSLSLWPNPFNPRTSIAFELASEGPVSLSVHDARGARVRRLIEGRRFTAGRHEVVWDGRGDGGRPLASGIYLIRLESASQSVARKAVLLE